MANRRVTSVLMTALFLALFGLAGCSSDDATDTNKPAPEPSRPGEVFADGGFDDVTGTSPDGLTPPKARPEPKPSGPALEVRWEALAHEKYLLENSRYRRRGPLPPQLIVLVNASHPNARAIASGRAGSDGANSAVISDKHMEGLIAGLKDRGYFKYARLGGHDAALASNENARGRVTVTQNGQSRSLVSMRGQGRIASTKEIPRIYSEAKQAIMVLRNMNPTLSVTRQGATGSASVR